MEILESVGLSRERLLEFQAKVRESDVPYLDFWIKENSEYSEEAKAAIAATLIPYERGESFQEANGAKKHWYKFLFQKMLGEHPDGGEGFRISSEYLTVITFNYDRSLEYYFFRQLKSLYRESWDIENCRFLNGSIVHMYGSLGQPVYSNREFPDSRPFDPNVTRDAVLTCMKCMQMVTAIDPPMLHGLAPDTDLFLKPADRVCFLGFGYAIPNIAHLGIREEILWGKEIYGTAYHLSETDKSEVKKRVPGINLGGPDEDVLKYLEREQLLNQAT